jgi:hypothetical protein
VEDLMVTGSTPVDATIWLKTNHQSAKASTTETSGQRLFSSIGCELASRRPEHSRNGKSRRVNPKIDDELAAATYDFTL